MRVEWKVLAGVGLILTPWAVVYWVFSYEAAGTAALVVTAVAFLFMAVYLAVQAREIGLRPEDREDATMAESAADLGYFPSASVWPITLAAASTVIGVGLVFSVWIALPGIALLVAAIAGLAVEAHRGATAPHH